MSTVKLVGFTFVVFCKCDIYTVAATETRMCWFFSPICLSLSLQIIEKLSINAPSGEVRLKVLKEIAQEYNLEWDSSSTEAELGKKHEDLLVHLII